MSRTRPNTADERCACLRAWRAVRSDLPPAIRQEYAPAAYTRAVRRYAAAQAREERARASVHATAEAFAVAFRGWAGTVVDEKNRRDSARVAALLGGLVPGRLPLRTPAEQLSRTADLRDHIARDPSLRRDEAQVRAVLDARCVLAVAVAARTSAEVRRARARSALDRAGRAFDLAWGALVRAIAPALTSKLPNFATRSSIRAAHADDGRVP